MPSKTKLFETAFLTGGHSDMLSRYELPEPFYYSSGDGIFRSDSSLGKKYKFFRFSKKIDYLKKSDSWNLTDDDKKMLKEEHSHLEFKKRGKTVEWIKFYGLGKTISSYPINVKIRREICSKPCVSCGTRTNIECDHKNDLYNNPLVLNVKTQNINDFQPLCKHCNGVKRQANRRRKETCKRQAAPGFPIKFTRGDETLNYEDPFWYIGTYWGDVALFKEDLCSMLSISK